MSLRVQSFIKGEISLHVLFRNKDPLFFGKEVAEILGYKDTDCAIRTHVDLEDKVQFKDLEGAQLDSAPFQYQPRRILINEIGLYSLVFGSQLPQAKAFRKWVYGEVLPQIRKTGSYSLHDGLLKLRDISEEDVLKMEDLRKKEFKQELKRFSELLKDRAQQERGSKGGSAFWRNYREKDCLLEKYKRRLETLQLLIEDLKDNFEKVEVELQGESSGRFETQ